MQAQVGESQGRHGGRVYPSPVTLTRLRVAALGLGLALLAPEPGHAAPSAPRYPLWPTEVDRAAGPLYSRGTERQASERQRADAVLALDEFATPIIETPLLWSLEDPSLQVRREALRLCFERAVVACIDGAATLYNDGLEPSLRIAALKVLALDGHPRSASILIAALRDNSEAIRAQAAELLGTAPLEPASHDKARTALLAKLPDVSAAVRRAAVISLGLLGPGDGALSIARVLDDPEPNVRAAAADALRHMRDERVVPALERAIESPNEPIVSKALVEALAVLAPPRPELEEQLLALVDDPPPGLNARQVADAIARRPEPGPTIVDGLIERLREPPLTDACLHALLVLGDGARPGIEAALDRGVEASLAVELKRLLAALEPPKRANASIRWPAAEDRLGWAARLDGPGPQRRLRSALELGARGPGWIGPMAAVRIVQSSTAAQRRAWIAVLARATGPVELGTSAPAAVAKLVGWTNDVTVAVGDRCLALLALGTVAAGDARHDEAETARDTLIASFAAGRPELRVCAGAAAPKAGLDADDLEGLLVDPDPRVRVAGALALAAYDPDDRSSSIATRLAAMQHADPRGEVRRAAEVARGPAPMGAWAKGTGLLLSDATPMAWADPPHWAQQPLGASGASSAEVEVWVPRIGFGEARWVVVPSWPNATPKSSKYSLPTDIEP